MKVGDRIVIVRDHYGDHNGYGKIGASGQIVHHDSAHNSLCWDVHLDEPLKDGRHHLWFSPNELQVVEVEP